MINSEPIPTAAQIVELLSASGNPEKARQMQRFFKTGPGQYGEGDLFLGIATPELRRVVGTFRQLPTAEAVELLHSPYHEIRSCGLLMLVEQYRRGDRVLKELIYRTYLKHTGRINNWDLVDLSAPGIVGEHLLSRNRAALYLLAASSWLWDQRIAVVSTLTLIRHGDFADTLKLAELLLPHRHDLMHKAVGWMLREVGKRDRERLTGFLNRHRDAMPRTMLRYAIEHYSEPERRALLAGKPPQSPDSSLPRSTHPAGRE